MYIQYTHIETFEFNNDLASAVSIRGFYTFLASGFKKKLNRFLYILSTFMLVIHFTESFYESFHIYRGN